MSIREDLWDAQQWLQAQIERHCPGAFFHWHFTADGQLLVRWVDGPPDSILAALVRKLPNGENLTGLITLMHTHSEPVAASPGEVVDEAEGRRQG